MLGNILITIGLIGLLSEIVGTFYNFKSQPKVINYYRTFIYVMIILSGYSFKIFNIVGALWIENK